MDQVRLTVICLPKPDVILDQMLICTGQLQGSVEGSNLELLDEGTHPTSQDFFHLSGWTTWRNAAARLVYL
jgi:hypothetical protein